MPTDRCGHSILLKKAHKCNKHSVFRNAHLDSSKPNINSVEVHSQQLSYNGHPMDGALVGAGSLVAGEGE